MSCRFLLKLLCRIVPVIINCPALLRHDILHVVCLTERISVHLVPMSATFQFALQNDEHALLKSWQSSTLV